ncbi:MAG: LOG family protein [Bacilli bacterium]|nr:LOG family protein [Bacilli bacterium]MDD3896047.1 LOG family protein [Bacilli bacterium]MDD4408129.1 LOG family protein [Bacilli bacterium]
MKVFIGLSSSIKINPKYYNLAKEVGTFLTDLNYNLICGSTDLGMAKIVSDIFYKKSTISLFIHKKYLNEIKDININYTLCDSNFDRLKKIYEESDIYVILPGGIGTLSELFGILEEIRDTNKKIILFNYNSYYNYLIEFLEKGVKANFIKEEDYKGIIIVKNMIEFKKEVINYEK